MANRNQIIMAMIARHGLVNRALSFEQIEAVLQLAYQKGIGEGIDQAHQAFREVFQRVSDAKSASTEGGATTSDQSTHQENASCPSN